MSLTPDSIPSLPLLTVYHISTLLGELPIEGRLHLDFLSVFYNIWKNPDTTIFRVVRYIIKMAGDRSSTWSAHLRSMCLTYGLPNPLELLESGEAWEKSKWSAFTKTHVTIHFENKLRTEAELNSKMEYFNVQVFGLSGSPHPALMGIFNVQEIHKLRFHIKFLCGDVLTAERQSRYNGSDPMCKLCQAPTESTAHALTSCRATADVRDRMLPELLNTVAWVQPCCSILESYEQPWVLTQFILDCTSLNLPDSYRVPSHNPNVGKIFALSRNWCYAIGKSRARLLLQLGPK